MRNAQDVIKVCKPKKLDGEWIVPVQVNGKTCEVLTYYALDRDDAIETAKVMSEDFKGKQ